MSTPKYDLYGNFKMPVRYQKLYRKKTDTLPIPEIKVLKVAEERGTLAIESSTEVEVKIDPQSWHPKLEQLDNKLLPRSLWNMRNVNYKIIKAYRYWTHPYAINLTVTKHSRVQMVNTVIDSSRVTTIYTEDGKSINRVILQVKNRDRQYLILNLPKSSTIWNLTVNGKPAVPARDRHRVMIPILISGNSSARAKHNFKVEFIYYYKTQEKEAQKPG